MYFTRNGVIATNITLRFAIHYAYGIYDERLWSGGPSQLLERQFDIQAKFDTTKYAHPSLVEQREMLQEMLAKRFKLRLNRGAREVPYMPW